MECNLPPCLLRSSSGARSPEREDPAAITCNKGVFRVGLAEQTHPTGINSRALPQSSAFPLTLRAGLAPESGRDTGSEPASSVAPYSLIDLPSHTNIREPQ
ncbi:unnamed protein product [Pleuronectes platessa]|uniref:Uncharacterized protein n=1 Tax=Pleuronectes platessa TaxID=8262 RepID=A0A9N7VSH9_PLEPL|nr:unnamed protein product [Pleuronectes platessa]